MNFNKTKIDVPVISYALLVVFALLTAGISFVLYSQTKEILEERLKERLRAIVNTASLQFSPEDILEVVDRSDIGTEPFERMTHQLQLIRNVNKDVYYAYLLRPTEDPNLFQFVVDADSIDPDAIIDLNKDGVIDDDDALAAPGDEYDASEVPSLVNDASMGATTDESPITADAWGTFLSGYAPIKFKGETIAILTIDVEVTDFINLITQTFFPFLVFVIFLFVILTSLTTSLVKMWGSRVDFLRELDRQKDELISMVSHQLATPITSIKWYVEMLLDGDMGQLNKDQAEHIKSMRSISADLSDLVSMLLDVSRIQLGRVKIEKQELNLDEFFKEIREVIEPKAAERGVQLTCQIPSALPVAMLDKRYTRMTIENLLSNAIKYTPSKGRVDFVVKIENGKVFCSVKDNGCGIPKADQDKIFGKLFRASNVRNAVDGNGFGLYVAKGAVEAQGGRIWFESEEGKGTAFYVELPLKDEEQAQKA